MTRSSQEKIDELSKEDLDKNDLEVLPPEILDKLGLGDEMSKGECQPGSYEPVIGDCTSYLSCGRDGKKQKQQCSGGLHWIQSKLACDWKELSDCAAATPRKSYPW